MYCWLSARVLQVEREFQGCPQLLVPILGRQHASISVGECLLQNQEVKLVELRIRPVVCSRHVVIDAK